jgi:site-specific DNA recombinase
MIGHKVKCSIKSNEYIRYYQCGNFHYKSSSVCSSNLVLADDSEECVFKRLHLLSRNKQVLSNVLSKVNQELHKHVLHSIISKITVNDFTVTVHRDLKSRQYKFGLV